MKTAIEIIVWFAVFAAVFFGGHAIIDHFRKK